MAERLSLHYLNGIGRDLSSLYQPGVELIIGSDGRAFADVLDIDDAVVTRYSDELGAMIEADGLSYLRYVTLEECYPWINDSRELRAQIPVAPGRDVASLHEEVRVNPTLLFDINGISRFLEKDFRYVAAGTGVSRTSIERKAREAAYKIVERGDGLRLIYAQRFPDAARLSIHPQKTHSGKMGIRLLETPDIWMTPWHSVAVETRPNSFTFAKLHQVEPELTFVSLDKQHRPYFGATYLS